MSLVVVLIPSTGVVYMVSSSVGGAGNAVGDAGNSRPSAALWASSPICWQPCSVSRDYRAGSAVFEVIRWAGVAYFVFMGVSMIRVAGAPQLDDGDD
jgi:hypothetical protein